MGTQQVMRETGHWRLLRLVGLLTLVLGFVAGLWPVRTSSLALAAPPTIVIDPGHGGEDIGAADPTGLLREKDLTLTLARKLAEILEADGVGRALVTRKEDQPLDLDNRAGFANSRGGEVFISLHVGNSFRHYPQGFTLYYWSPAFQQPAGPPPPGQGAAWDQGQVPYSGQSRRLAGLIERELRQALEWPSGGIVAADLYLLRRVRMPAVLLEIGSLNYSPEADELPKPSFQDAVARSITKALRRFEQGK
jgi:N-acetylmuramoyl-L-alanine amidase